MKILRIPCIVLCMSLPVLAVQVADIVLDEAAAFAFPTLVLGTQEEVFQMPYATQEQMDSYQVLGLKSFRYPCGTPSSWFAWHDVSKGYWPDNDFFRGRKIMPPDDFLAMCKRYSLEPVLTVNTNLRGGYNEGSTRINPTKLDSIRAGAQYAAKWVQYQNAEKKDGVKYWEIDNETWCWMTSDEYPVFVREYSKAMRRVDPRIKIIAVGLSEDVVMRPTWLQFPDDPNWQTRQEVRNTAEEWTKKLLKNAAGYFSYLAPHIYYNGPFDALENGKELFAKIHANRELQEQIRWIQESNLPVRLAVTEWQINVVWQVFNATTRLNSGTLSKEEFDKLNFETTPTNYFVTGLAGADWIGKMASSGYVDIAINHTMFDGLGLIWESWNGPQTPQALIQPVGIAIQFWDKFRGEKILPVQVQNAPEYEHKGQNVPLLSAYATEVDANTVNLILINRSPDTPVKLNLPSNIHGKNVIEIVENMYSAPSWGTSVWPAFLDRAKYPITFHSRTIEIMQDQPYAVQPCAMICLQLKLDPKLQEQTQEKDGV